MTLLCRARWNARTRCARRDCDPRRLVRLRARGLGLYDLCLYGTLAGVGVRGRCRSHFQHPAERQQTRPADFSRISRSSWCAVGVDTFCEARSGRRKFRGAAHRSSTRGHATGGRRGQVRTKSLPSNSGVEVILRAIETAGLFHPQGGMSPSRSTPRRPGLVEGAAAAPSVRPGAVVSLEKEGRALDLGFELDNFWADWVDGTRSSRSRTAWPRTTWTGWRTARRAARLHAAARRRRSPGHEHGPDRPRDRAGAANSVLIKAEPGLAR